VATGYDQYQVLRLNPDDGSIEQAFDVVDPNGVLFDGTSIWVASADGTVTNISVEP
jgi:hypothetical protein